MNEEPQVLYCDAWLMAIDKPAGMIVHGDGTGERTLTDYASDLLLAMATALPRPTCSRSTA